MSENAGGEIPRYPDELKVAATVVNGVNTGIGREVSIRIGGNRDRVSIRQLLQRGDDKAAAAVLRRRYVLEGCGEEESGGAGKGIERKGRGIYGIG